MPLSEIVYKVVNKIHAFGMNAEAYGRQSATVTSTKRRLFVSMRVTEACTSKFIYNREAVASI